MTKEQRLAANKRLTNLASKEAQRHDKILDKYLNSKRAKRLRKNAEDARAMVNVLIGQWNDIVLERAE